MYHLRVLTRRESLSIVAHVNLLSQLIAPDTDGCCQACAEQSACTDWVLQPSTSVCSLYKDVKGTVSRSDRIYGSGESSLLVDERILHDQPHVSLHTVISRGTAGASLIAAVFLSIVDLILIALLVRKVPLGCKGPNKRPASPSASTSSAAAAAYSAPSAVPMQTLQPMHHQQQYLQQQQFAPQQQQQQPVMTPVSTRSSVPGSPVAAAAPQMVVLVPVSPTHQQPQQMQQPLMPQQQQPSSSAAPQVQVELRPLTEASACALCHDLSRVFSTRRWIAMT